MSSRVPTSPIDCPLLDHPIAAESRFRAADLVASVCRSKGMENIRVPAICVLEFDGDLTDDLIARGEAQESDEWACFHTQMWLWHDGASAIGIVPRTIGGPYAVLVAEQLLVCGAQVVVGLTSSGRISPSMPVPGFVVADEAIRDEGTSTHYLKPSRTVASNPQLATHLADAMTRASIAVERGTVWTTDAPYRETPEQIQAYAREGVLAVEMQAASLFAFGRRMAFPVGLVAHVTNGSDVVTADFDKGDGTTDYQLLRAISRGSAEFLATHRSHGYAF